MAVKPRLFVLTDIDNEPDDAESFVRLLLYTNEIDLEGVVAVTSTWLRYEVHPETLQNILDGYEAVHANLLRHDSAYPPVQSLRALIKPGYPGYGTEGVGQGKDTEGSEALIAAVDREDEHGRPLHVALWGGANCLAQALWKVESTRTPEETLRFASKIFVYAISDQDNTGPIIRRKYPCIPYVVSLHGNNSYSLATWHGISGELITGDKTGPPETIQKDWLAKHIQIGPLGLKYPTWQFLMEGDTPSFLGLVPNGLNNAERPDWGGWGGRYDLVNDPEAKLYADSVDSVVSPLTGHVCVSPQASIWRWREHFQQDFRARMQRTLNGTDPDTLRAPQVIVNGDSSLEPLRFTVQKGSTIELDASETRGSHLTFKWYHYKEVSTDFGLAPGFPTGDFTIIPDDQAKVRITVPSKVKLKAASAFVFEKQRDFHVILQVTKDKEGEIPLTRYRRVIFTVLE
ncbi:hypothetical protein I317_07366 [Kwoniella heveanensis CBS 569]|nr:hypothetical protein I317_07366 [Kwoniella heveanensis CBS 569]